MQNIENWRTEDPCPNVPLDQIEELPVRARALLARNRDKPLLKIGFVNVVGAIDMMRGLVYHHNNFVRSYDRLKGLFPNNDHLDHEIVAYFNRMGQFYFFARSKFVKQAIPDYTLLIPTIQGFLIFRNKFSAHRSMDAPKGEAEADKIAHARSLTSSFGSFSRAKPGANMPEHPSEKPDGTIPIALMTRYMNERRKQSYRSYQTFDERNNSHVSFTLQLEHPKIMSEVYGIIEAVITHV